MYFFSYAKNAEFISLLYKTILGNTVVKTHLPVQETQDTGSIPESGRSLGEGNSNPLQYSCLGHPVGREAWWATVHKVAKSRTQSACAQTHT